MPLKLRVRRRKKASGGGDGDTASVASAASKPETSAVQTVYHVQKEKELPKLHRAVWKGNLDKVKKLTKSMKTSELNSTDKEKRTALHYACAGSCEDIVSYLCTVAKADPNTRDSSGCTPIHRCIQANSSSTCLNTLIEAGAKVNEADRQGHTPLHVAAERGHCDVIALLQDHGANIEAMEKNGCTAVHIAAMRGHKDTVSQLIRDGADINRTDGQGCTALMLGARGGHLEVMRVLRESRADPELQDQAGLRATDHALRHNQQHCAQLAEEYQLLWVRAHAPTSSHSPPSTPSHHSPPDSRLKIDDPWASGSEEGDIPDGPQRNLSHGGLGVSGINLREAMAKAKLPPIKKAEDEVEGQTSPEPCPLVGVASHGQQDVDDMLSDWDDEKDESTCKPHPSPLAASSAHIPAVVGASREPSALQHGRVGMSGGGEVGGSEGGRDDRVGPLGGTITARAAILERSNVNGEIETELEDGSSLSSEPESDIPLFGGYSPSTQTITHSSLPRLPPISQGSPPHSETPAATPPLQRMQLSTPSPTPTSPTVVTPLPLTTGGLSPERLGLGHLQDERTRLNEPGLTRQKEKEDKGGVEGEGKRGEEGDGEGSDWFSTSDEEGSEGERTVGGQVYEDLQPASLQPASLQPASLQPASLSPSSQEPVEDMDDAAARRKYERDNEFLLTFQARQQRKHLPGISAQRKAGLDSKSEPALFPFPDSHTPSPEGHGSCNNLSGSSNPESGSRVQLMKKQWEMGVPLKLPPFNEPQSATLTVNRNVTRQGDHGRVVEQRGGGEGEELRDEGSGRVGHSSIIGAGVLGLARETPVTGGRTQRGEEGGGGRGGGRDGDGDGRADEVGGDDWRDSGRAGGEAGGGGRRGGGGGRGGGRGGDNGRRHEKDKDEEKEETDKEEGEEEGEGGEGEVEGEELRGISSTTPLLQTRSDPRPSTNDPTSSTAAAMPQWSGRGQVLATPTPLVSQLEDGVVFTPADQLKIGRTSSQSELWSTDSSSADILLPPPPLHSTLLTASPAPLTPSHLHYLPLHTVKSNEGREEERESMKPSTEPTETKPHDIKAESHDPSPESHDTSEPDHWDEPTHSHLSPAHQSLLGSAHLSQLETSLHDTQHSLNRSQRSIRSGEEVRRRLQAQLEETRHRLNDVTSAKLTLETVKLDQELKVREMSYQLQQEREAVKSGQATVAALREQVGGLEERLAREMEQRQVTELQRREAELQARSNLVLSQQVQDQLSELASQLQTEKEAKAVQEGLYREQVRLFQELQSESSRMQEQKTEVTGQLQEAHSGRQSLEEQLQRLQRQNTQLQVELSGERCRSEEVRGRLEGEVEEMRERLREKTEKLVSAEDALLASRQQFECDLGELRGKVNTLSSGLDAETSSSRQLESERDRLSAQLDNAKLTLQATTRRNAAKEKELYQTIETHRQEREAAERELAGSRARLEELTSRSTALETRLVQAESEGRDHAGQVLKWTNQVAILQKEAEQWQQRVASLGEDLTREKAASSESSSSLASRERELAAVQAEVVRLTEQLSGAQQMLEEREASARREQSRTDELLDSIRGDYNHSKSSLEERCRSLVEEVQSLREEGTRRGGEGKEREREVETLRTQLHQASKAREEVEGQLRAAQESCGVLERERRRVEETVAEKDEEISTLREALGRGEREGEALRQELLTVQNSLSLSEGRMRELASQCEEEGRREVKQERERVGDLERQLREGREREENLHRAAQAMTEERTRLHEAMTRVQGEVIQLREERKALQVAAQVSQRETAEARGLWETEIKSRASMSLRVLELEQSHQQVTPTIETEKRRAQEAQEKRKVAELKYESLQQHCSGLEREVGEVRAELRAARKRLRGVEKEAESREGEGISQEAELCALRKQLESTRQQLVREADVRMRAEQAVTQASQQLEAMAAQRDTAGKDKELQRLQRANHQLQEEVKRLDHTMAHSMVDHRDMETALRRAEDEAHLKLSKKLQEVNVHLEQQSLAHSTLQRRTEAGMRRQLDDLQRQAAQAKKFKELYEAEVGRSERLEERVRLAEQAVEQAESKMRFERSRTEYLLSNSSHTHPTHPHPFTSTPHKLNLKGHASSATDQLLKSVRSELDRSISKHLASVPLSSTTIKRPATHNTSHAPSDATHPARLSLSTSRHLDSIRRNYHV